MNSSKAVLYIRTYDDNLLIQRVVDVLPIKPCRYWQKGDEIIVNGIVKNKKYPSSNWCYEYVSNNISSIGEVLIPLLNDILPYANTIHDLKNIYGFNVYITIVIKAVDNKFPKIEFNKYIISCLGKLDVELDFDLYIG